MSDPMTNTDVEDVLASIRRLVSDDGRPAAAGVQRPPSDRLVLTPSLRVTEEAESEAESAHGESAQHHDSLGEDLQEEPDTDVDDASLVTFAHTAFRKEQPDADDVAEPEADDVAEPEADDVAEPEADDVAELEADDAAELEADDAAEQDDGATSQATPDRDASPSEDAWPQTDDADAAEQENDAEYTAQSAPSPGEPLVESASEDMADPVDMSEPAQVPEDWDEETAAARADTQVDDPDVSTPKPAAQSLSEKIATLETLVGARRDQFEPDDPGADAYAGTEPPAMEWEDAEADADPAEEIVEEHAEPEPEYEVVDATPDQDVEAAAPEPEAEPEPEVDAGANDASGDAYAALFGPEDDVLDEDALRELISEIVREELQGALGERITRNVRKLVRREIHRALAAQDLE